MYDMALADTVSSDTREIARGLRERDVALLQMLVEEYQDRLVRYLVYVLGRRDGVDDLVQETWLRVMERGKSYDGRSRFEPWLFTVARHLAIDFLRRRREVSLDAEDDGRPVVMAPVSEMPPLGGLGRRLSARIIDTVLLAIVGVPLSLVAYAGSSHDRTARTVGVDVVLALVGFVYEGLMLTLSRGQTVGKKVMRIRVAVLANGAVPSGSTGWIRSAVYWLPGIFSALCIPALFSLLNILWCTWDRPYRQCLHDKAAKTVVVRTD